MTQLFASRKRATFVFITALLVMSAVGVAFATEIPAGCDPSIGVPDQAFSDTCQTAKSSSYGDTHGGLAAWAQRTVNDTGTKSLTVDGIFGSQTESGVKDYQTDTGTTADGIVGSNTWIRMDNVGNIAPWYPTSGGCIAGLEFHNVAGESIGTAEACDDVHTYLDEGEWCVKPTSGGWKVANTVRWTGCT